jgi:histo-blood group ABO system transferase
LKYLFKYLLLISLVNPYVLATQEKQRYKIGLLVMATGKYTVFLDKLLQTADQYFLPGHEKTYFIFTDGQAPESDHVVRIEQKRLGWPYDTMMRFRVYYESADAFAGMDYLFACDADMFFADVVGDEILGERVATRHPGFCLPHQRHDDYERDSVSTAYVGPDEGEYYFAGGFYGGSMQEMVTLMFICSSRIDQDLENGFIAHYHDESHLNRYFIDYKPTVILSPAYCHPGWWDIPFEQKIMAVAKNHAEFQTPK